MTRTQFLSLLALPCLAKHFKKEKPIVTQFKNGVLETNDAGVISFLRNHPRNGIRKYPYSIHECTLWPSPSNKEYWTKTQEELYKEILGK